MGNSIASRLNNSQDLRTNYRRFDDESFQSPSRLPPGFKSDFQRRIALSAICLCEMMITIAFTIVTVSLPQFLLLNAPYLYSLYSGDGNFNNDKTDFTTSILQWQVKFNYIQFNHFGYPNLLRIHQHIGNMNS